LNRQGEAQMAEWFDERYISREEHQQIVDYYRKLVASLQHSLCTAQRAEVRFADIVVDEEAVEGTQREGTVRGNVIHVDFRSRG